MVRSISSCGLSVLRAIEEHLMSKKAEHLTVKCSREVAFYVLNEKRDNLLSIEQAYGISVFIVPSDDMKGSQAVIERAGERNIVIRKAPPSVKIDSAYEEDAEEEVEDIEVDSPDVTEVETVPSERGETSETPDDGADGGRGKRRRRGRRGGRRGGRDMDDNPMAAGADGESDEAAESGITEVVERDEVVSVGGDGDAPAGNAENEGGERGPKRRRDRWGRNRNGRNRSGREASESEASPPAEARDIRSEREVVAPPAAVIEILSKPVEVRKWQPPAPTIAPTEIPKPKAGWWSKRG